MVRTSRSSIPACLDISRVSYHDPARESRTPDSYYHLGQSDRIHIAFTLASVFGNDQSHTRSDASSPIQKGMPEVSRRPAPVSGLNETRRASRGGRAMEAQGIVAVRNVMEVIDDDMEEFETRSRQKAEICSSISDPYLTSANDRSPRLTKSTRKLPRSDWDGSKQG